jgi:hypothetical protein
LGHGFLIVDLFLKASKEQGLMKMRAEIKATEQKK